VPLTLDYGWSEGMEDEDPEEGYTLFHAKYEPHGEPSGYVFKMTRIKRDDLPCYAQNVTPQFNEEIRSEPGSSEQ